MKLYLVDGKKINMYSLPKKIEDSFLINYNTDNNLEETINIVAENGQWIIESNPETAFFSNGKAIIKDVLENNSSFQVKFSDINTILMLYAFETPITYKDYELSTLTNMTIGRSQNSTIFYDNPYVSPANIEIIKQNGYWTIENKYLQQPVYINGYCISKAFLKMGDSIFFNGLKIIWMDTFIKINIPKDKIIINLSEYKKVSTSGNKCGEVSDTEKASILYNDNQIFFHTPRLKETVKENEIEIQLPPQKEEESKMPFMLQMGSSIVMGASSSITGVIAVFNIAQGKATILSSITELSLCASMLLGCILFPILIDKYQKKEKRKKELKREKKYQEYLNNKVNDINKLMEKEKEIRFKNNLSIKELQDVLIKRSNKIWDREITDPDFLTLRLGVGNIKPSIYIKAPKEEFSLEDDDLRTKAFEVINKKLVLENVPITISLIEDKILPIIIKQNYPYKQQYIDALILQLITYYSGVDLKIAVITTEDNKKNWEYLKYLPHCSSNDQENHFFACNEDEIKQLVTDLEKIRLERVNFKNSNNQETKKNEKEEISKLKERYKEFDEYYLIITDNFISAKKYDFIHNIIESDANYGFSVLMIEETMKNVPSKCNHFVDINETVCGVFSKDLEDENQNTFIPEIQPDNNNADYAHILANIPIIGSNASNSLPSSLNFLEMYKVGKIEQLNIVNRWVNNDPTQSLHTPLGVRTDGKLFEIDLHEKAHGPHGLIAGATGSGKSEFIITFILSMAINYHPYEVSFVLIDYKGGGLAGAFENKETGIRLPHLAGTITNLDESEMNRTLVSIKSELKRRQRMFNEARDALNESTVDIYKYQKFFREGKVKEPISHLFIISDEFAELKSQQPDFMEELVSTARIGRSLGVHLILATQKPSGVVDDQIWSNARFKICLKVQTAEDSMELLKRDDAASIKETGRFYLQVGFNELFEIGQSAWSGAKYIPTDRILKSYEDDISIIDDNGNIIKKINNSVKKENQVDMGEQLTNIVKTLYDISIRDNIKSQSLWLPSLNPVMYINNLIKKYNYNQEKYIIEPIIGEYDVPENQFQDKLTINLNNCGNVVIYGNAGSGKENLLETLIYSTCIYHSTDEVNFYILDFGAEVLSVFNKMPQVGDIATALEKDKLISHFANIEREINKRKELFKDFGGSYESYLNQSENKLPLIVIILNNYDSFVENYSDLDDVLTHQLRDCAKYGIVFITTSVATNSMRASVQALYNTKMMMQVNDAFDYSYILDAQNHLTPAKYFGRGLIKLDNGTYEFQTAYIFEKDKINEVVKQTADKLIEIDMKKASKIPNIPKNVVYETMLKYISELDKVPVGFNVKNGSISYMNILSRRISIITGKQVNAEPTFLLELVKIINSIPSAKLRIIDLADNMSGAECNEIYTDGFTDSINGILTAEEETKQKVIYIITGIGYIYDRVLDEGIEKLFEIFNDNSKLLNTHFILSDNMSSFRKLEQEEWYKNMDKSSGIWLGQNIDGQSIINISNLKNYDANEQVNGLGYNIINGNYEVIRSIGTVDEEEGDAY